jgi:hypothetical protein
MIHPHDELAAHETHGAYTVTGRRPKGSLLILRRYRSYGDGARQEYRLSLWKPWPNCSMHVATGTKTELIALLAEWNATRR